MSRPNPFTLAALMAAVALAATWLGLDKGGLYPTWQEGDMLHMVQIVLREAAGEWPHLDFMTPLGWLAYAPITLFVRMGQTLADAFVMAQALVAAALLPAAWWAAFSRLGRGWAHLFGAAVMVLVVALVPASADTSISLSMNYNRWAWAIAFTVLLVALVPARTPGRGASVGDGVTAGLGLSVLALIKVTYFAGFAPVVLLALVLRRDRLALGVGLGAGLAVLGAVTLAAGPAIWPAYLGDLLTVAGSDERAFPTASFGTVLAGVSGRVDSALFLVAVILLRRSGQARGGLLLLLAGPGLSYVTYQNFGNEPVWLFLLGVVVLALRPRQPGPRQEGPDLRQGLTVIGWVALILSAPFFMSMAESPLRNYTAKTEDQVAVLPGAQGLWMPRERVQRVQIRTTRRGPWWQPTAGPERTLFQGELLEDCLLVSGLVGWYQDISADIEAAGLAGRPALVADILNSYWLFGGVERLAGGAPWYYGGLPGVMDAQAVLVPQCPARPKVRARILTAIEEAGLELNELRRTDDYILLAVMPKSTASTR
ncbi:MAG: DUF2029 domain-containing protein [Rhodobacteraceae bacterium]|nr:DUF2029 domain-containing protein [Paracoccaceae bacterium]